MNDATSLVSTPATRPPAIAPHTSGGARRANRVLVVEDEPPIRKLIELVLSQQFQCEVDQAQNGLEAVSLLETNRYELVVSDLRMSVMGGMGLYRWLREHQPVLAGRMILITGYTRDENLGREIAEYVIPVLPKPFSIPVLCRMCDRFLPVGAGFTSAGSRGSD